MTERHPFHRPIYLDTNAIIFAVESNEESLARLLEDAAADLVRLFTSELTLAEVLVGPMKSGNQKLIEQYEMLLANDGGLTVVPIDRTILWRSAELQAALGNKGADSIHIATAGIYGCEVFVSSDRRLRMPPGIVRVPSSVIINLDGIS